VKIIPGSRFGQGPYRVPDNPAARLFGALIEEIRFARDSPLEGRRFEPSVPSRR
jgi:hypothetical protein